MPDDRIDEVAPEDTGEPIELSHTKGRRAFNRLRRELSDDELSSTAVQRMLLDDIERLENENAKLSGYQNGYYSADKKAAVLTEQLKTNVGLEVAFGVCLTVGAALVGLAPSVSLPGKPSGWIVVALGLILIIGGIASKVRKR